MKIHKSFFHHLLSYCLTAFLNLSPRLVLFTHLTTQASLSHLTAPAKAQHLRSPSHGPASKTSKSTFISTISPSTSTNTTPTNRKLTPNLPAVSSPSMTGHIGTRSLPHRAHRVASSLASLSTPSNAYRSFFSLSGHDTQNLAATRTLPYTRDALYSLIVDVDSYSQFLPYCSQSCVTQWSQPDADGRRLPLEANLQAGWAGFSEIFTSRLRCVPGVSVEAVSGKLVSPSKHQSPVFKSLMTRWSLEPISSPPSPSTKIHLTIEYQFTNPLYSAVSAAVSDKVAGVMIEAFQAQAQRRFGTPDNS